MSYAAINSQILTVINTVSGIANANDMPRWATDQTDFDTKFLSGTIYHAWWIERVRTEAVFLGLGSELETQEVFQIHGIYNQDDSNTSYKTMQGLVDGVLDGLNAIANVDLNNTGLVLSPATLLSFVTERFPTQDGILMHKAIIEFPVKTLESP